MLEGIIEAMERMYNRITVQNLTEEKTIIGVTEAILILIQEKEELELIKNLFMNLKCPSASVEGFFVADFAFLSSRSRFSRELMNLKPLIRS